MIIRKVDSENDWEFGKGLASYATDEQAVDENVKTRLLSWVGDCFFDLQAGIDWRARLDIGQQDELENELKTEILQSYGVVAVLSVDANFSGTTRLFDATYNIQTIYSQNFQATIQQAAGS